MEHVVRISDGLGNQMFQYAFAYALHKRTGVPVLIDPLFWGTSLRKYQLEEFHITLTKRMVCKAWDYLLGFGPRNGRRFKDRYRQNLIQKRYRLIQERQIMHYNETVMEQNEPCFYMGFWQTPRYFEDYYEDLQKEFTRRHSMSPDALAYLDKIKADVSVSLHIRRTDYVRGKDSVTLDAGFYREALNRIREEIGDFRLYVFTDDKQFVRERFHLQQYVLIEGVSDLDEFELMRRCDHHIVANSTFSWWAAYLGDRKGGVVYAPCTGIWSKEFYPREWNLLDAATADPD